MPEVINKSTEIQSFFDKLNAKDKTPKNAYRRNAPIYSLICYVNNITGCYLSDNLDPIPVFIERSRLHMDDIYPDDESQEYYLLVSEYLDFIEKYVLHSSTL